MKKNVSYSCDGREYHGIVRLSIVKDGSQKPCIPKGEAVKIFIRSEHWRTPLRIINEGGRPVYIKVES